MASTTSMSRASRAPAWFMRLSGTATPLQAKRALWGYIYVLPWLIGLLLFMVGPIIASAYFSLTSYDVLDPPKWIGLENYTKAFTGDKQFWPSLGRTFTYALATVPIGLAGSLFLALLLNQGISGTGVFRTLFFLPSLTPTVALAILWKWLLHPSVGPVNTVLGWLGIPGPGWLTVKAWAMPALIIISLWGSLGGTRMIIFLAGLQGVPRSLYEAAELDGAGTWDRFWNITLPMISPTFLFNLILGVIGALKVFSLAFVATQGGPSYATWFYALHIYRQAFTYFRMGYGSALAWIFVVILIVFTYLQMSGSRKWVYYAGENE